ncbi:MAG TPA: PilZ domain-containing protein [Geminicoccaceae bacterium]|nr:PilZ domain-containing protein [Geminicoccaceae bacterium]
MRQFIRHPATVPIEVSAGAAQDSALREAMNVSLGGLAFQADQMMAPGGLVEVRIPLVRPPFAAWARVVWCRPGGRGFELGVAFLEAADAFRARMVEQVCHIEAYREAVHREEGRNLSGREAAAEWIAKHAADFADIGQAPPRLEPDRR